MVRVFSVPPNIYALEHVHEKEESDEDAGEVSVDELVKDDRPFYSWPPIEKTNSDPLFKG